MRLVSFPRRGIVLGTFIAAVALLPGCDACGSSGEPPRKACVLDDGTEIGAGASAPASDGCNICVCNSALELDCTARPCDDAGPPREDAGPEGDAGPEEQNDAGVDEGPCHDDDDDGFYACVDPEHPERPTTVDCDDERFHVQPGGIEFPETTEDDNCDGHNDDWLACDCAASASSATELASAMDLCGDEVASATKSGSAGQFGIVNAYQNVVDVRLRARQDNPQAPPIIIGNSCMAILSTGDATGTATGVNASNCNFPDPDPENPSTTTPICDLARLDLTLHAPPNAEGFSFDFMFLSYEWPEYLCLEFNDTFYATVRTPAVNAGAPTNAAFDLQGRPITVNVGFFENPSSWTVPLEGTSLAATSSGGCPSIDLQQGCNLPSYCNDNNLDVRSGSGSGWLTTSVPIEPGQQDLRVTLTVHDESDEEFDSLVLLDGFRWLPARPTLQTAKEP